jgi:hypothetical protein
MSIESGATAEIRGRLSALEQAWCRLDFAAIRSLWDTGSEPIYFAEESPQAKLTWTELEAYWSLTGRLIEKMGMRVLGEPVMREIAPGMISVIYDMHWDALIRGESRAVGGDNRVCATFRLTATGWRFAQYVEAPLAPITYLRRLYEQSVTPGFSSGE